MQQKTNDHTHRSHPVKDCLLETVLVVDQLSAFAICLCCGIRCVSGWRNSSTGVSLISLEWAPLHFGFYCPCQRPEFPFLLHQP